MQKVKVLVEVFDETETIEAVKVNENCVIYVDGDKVAFQIVKATNESNVYEAISPAVWLAENVVIDDEQQILNDILKTLTKMTFLDYLTKVCDHRYEYNFNLISKGESKVKNYK